MSHKYLYILFLSFPFLLFSQNRPGYDPLVIIAKAENENTRLKFVPLDVDTWLKSIEHGFMIERAEVNGLDTGTFQVLNAEPVVPATREQWTNLSTEDSLATYARQMLYNEAQQNLPSSFAEKFEASKRLERRHFFFLYFTTRSRLVSRYSGMEWLDESADPEKSYVYRIYVSSQKGNPTCQAEKTIRQDRLRDVPSPRVESQGVEQAVNLRWMHEGYENVFFSYDVERSKDGKRYEVINDAPLLYNTNRQTPRGMPGLMNYTDSVKSNYETYYYRVVAYDYFGDPHEPSQPVQQMGRDRTPPLAPSNVEATPEDNGFEITWDHDGLDDDLAGFIVVKSTTKITGPFDRVHEAPLEKDARKFRDSNADFSEKNFYMVLALDTAGNYSTSLAAYAFLPDTVPPAAPTGMQYEVDTNGVLRLQWDEGKEDDLKGYRVFRSVNKKFDMVLRSQYPIMAYNFTDTLPMKTLDETYYYRVVAIDQNHNHSEYSDFLEVKKPDLIPPTAPLLTDLQWEKDHMVVNIIPSSSDDVKGYRIYRKAANATEWTEVGNVGPAEDRFIDRFEPTAMDYDYRIRALDDDGHHSEFSNTKRARVQHAFNVAPVNSIEAAPHPEKGIVLNWSYSEESAGKSRFIIYRSTGEEKLTMYRSVSGDQFTFHDYSVDPGTLYNYGIKVQNSNGQRSAMSTVSQVELP